MSAALQTRCRLNTQPPGPKIYASRPRAENARTCRMASVSGWVSYGLAAAAMR